MTVFVDTSAFYAHLNGADEAHESARDTFGLLLDSGEPLVTHNYVVLETIALTQRRLGLAAVALLRDAMLPVAPAVWIDQEVHAHALTATLAAGRRDVSFTDHVSFELMRRRRIERVFAFDAHFAEYGFEVVVR